MGYEGTVVLNYKLTKKLGEGGFGAVYLAEQVDLGRRAAVKILHPQYAREPSVVERFFREARAVLEIGHRAIIGIENYGTLPAGEPFYLMEYFPGASLGQLSSERWLSSAQLIAAFDPVADALSAAHAKHIVHRDLKPDNIMIRIADDKVADVRLLDFGIAKLLDGDTRYSVTGSAMGTPAFMAPEQALDAKNVDERADVYSFGATVYTALCGQPPFDGTSTAAVLIRVQTDMAPLIASFRPGVPDELDAAIRRCLAKQREHRPASVAEAWATIRAALAAANLTAGNAPQAAASDVPATMAPDASIEAPPPAAPPPATPPTSATAAESPGARGPVASPVPVPATVEPSTPKVDEDAGRSRAFAFLGIGGLGVIALVVTIAVMRSGGGAAPADAGNSSDAATVASIDAVAVDAAAPTPDAIAVVSSDATALDAAVAIADAAPVPVDAASRLPRAPSQAEIRAQIDRLQRRFQACRAAEPFAGGPSVSLPTIDLRLSFFVTPSGRVTNVKTSNGSPSVGACVKRLVSVLRFRRSQVGRSFSTVLELKGREGVVQEFPKNLCVEPRFDAKRLTTEAAIDRALAQLNRCKSQLGDVTFRRLQQALVQRKLQL